MAVTTIPIGVGSAPGDGLGDPARTGGQSINTSVANLDAAVELLQSGGWSINSAAQTVALGDKIVTTAQAGTVAKTFPAVTSAPSATDYNDIWILNGDVNGNDVTLTPDGTDEFFYDGASLGAGVTKTLGPGQMAFATRKASGDWNLFLFYASLAAVEDLTNVVITSIATGELFYWNGSNWINGTLEELDIVDRAAPAIETTPYLKHETRSARASGTETITCADDPSVYLPISGNNVTINLDTPALSLPVRGLSEVQLRGTVNVVMNGAYTGLTVTTDAGTKQTVFPKGTAPTASGERSTLVWMWFDDGTTDYMRAEWVPDA